MGLLEGKKVLIFGVANDRSIAWGIAEAMHRHGAEIGFSYAGEALGKRVRPLAEKLGVTFVEQCDVGSDEQIEQVFAKAGEHFGHIDILVHAVAYAKKDEISGRFIQTSREGFRLALDISAYSFIALTKAAVPLLRPGSSILTLSYYGAQKVIGRYNAMGVAKAALETSVRYMAADLGPTEGIRVNCISAGPIRTLAASGIEGFRQLQRQFEAASPLRRVITIEDVGNAAVWISSDMASAVTGEILFVDAGFNILAVSEPKEESAPKSES
jgi:enoyl-[acyl-carrier protein] reductase I